MQDLWRDPLRWTALKLNGFQAYFAEGPSMAYGQNWRVNTGIPGLGLRLRVSGLRFRIMVFGL